MNVLYLNQKKLGWVTSRVESISTTILAMNQPGWINQPKYLRVTISSYLRRFPVFRWCLSVDNHKPSPSIIDINRLRSILSSIKIINLYRSSKTKPSYITDFHTIAALMTSKFGTPSISGCLARLKSFLATMIPSLKRYSYIAIRFFLGINIL